MSQNAAGRKNADYYLNIIQRWRENSIKGDEYENHFLKFQKEYRKYYPNVYILNSKALVIQHAVFGWLSNTRKILPNSSTSPLSSSQVLFKPKYRLDDVSRPSSVKRKEKNMIKKCEIFDNKENILTEKSVNISL